MKAWEIFETLNEFVYVCDPCTYELVYMNRKCREFFGVDDIRQLSGKKCYQLLCNSGVPCAVCNNRELKLNEFMEGINYNPILKKTVSVKDTLIEVDGKIYRVEIAMDVSLQGWREQARESKMDLHAIANEALRSALDQKTPDLSIQAILDILGKLLQASRTYIFELNESGNTDNTYEWVSAQAVSAIDSLQNVPASLLDSWYKHFKNNNELYIPDIEALKETDMDQYEALVAQDIHSLMVVPLQENKEIIGFYGVDNPSDDLVDQASSLLQILAAFIMTSIKRRNLLEDLQQEEQLKTEASLARQTQENLDMLNDIIGSGLWFMEFDTSGEMTRVSWSQKFREMLGFTSAEDFPDTLESWSDRLHPLHKEQILDAFWDTIDGRREYDVEYLIRLRDGSYEWFHANGRVARHDNGQPRLFLGTFINITKERKAQLALESALEAANKANVAKTQFLSNMSHDMRTPLNGIIGMLEMEECFANSQEKQRECRQKIRTSAIQLLSLVNDVLDMSRPESGHAEFEAVHTNLKQLVEECMEMTESQANTKGVFVEARYINVEHPDVLSSPVHLRRILLNLVSNAIKFNRNGGRVDIVLEEVQHDPVRTVFRIEVWDTGIGMKPEFIPRAFDAFSQANGTARTQFQGTGLGLAIVKTTVEQMGGSLALNSIEGKGTTFTITMSFESEDIIQEAARDDLASEAAEQLDLSGKRVLLVEDNELNMEIAEFMLEESGMEVTTAENGLRALEIYVDNPAGTFDLILMDLMMPVMDGLESSRNIRNCSHADAKTIPILALTANAFFEDIQHCTDAGMNGHISKPIDMDAAIKTIAHALSA